MPGCAIIESNSINVFISVVISILTLLVTYE